MTNTKELNAKMTASELTADLKPLIEEFYIGKVSDKNGSIELILTNGQKFKITVEEIA